MKIEKIKISELRAYDGNAKLHPEEQVKQIAESIKRFGFCDPVGVWRDNTVIEGHGRLLALKSLGYEEVECIRLDHLTDEERRAYALAHNSTNLSSGFDEEALRRELAALPSIDMAAFGLEVMKQLECVAGKEALLDDFDPDAAIARADDAQTKAGDVYQLGRHRLMCGDSTNKEDVRALMDGELAELVFCDPPYGMGKEADGVLNDNLNRNDLLEFNRRWIDLSLSYLSDNGSWYCWGVDEPLMDIYANILRPRLDRKELTFRNLITWDKGAGQGQNQRGRLMYATADEKCLFVMKGLQVTKDMTTVENFNETYTPIVKWLASEAKKAKLTPRLTKELCGCGMFGHWFSKAEWTLITREHYGSLQKYASEQGLEAFVEPYDELKKRYDTLTAEWYALRAYFDNVHDNMNNVWHFERPTPTERKDGGDHATPKPVKLCERAVVTSLREGGVALDMFGGSGSTLMACEITDRCCRMMELEPRLVDVIVDRWESFTGLKAERVRHV